MATYSITTTARQDAALAAVAAKRGVPVQALVDAELARILQRALNEADRDAGEAVSAAYLAGTPAQRTATRTALGLP